MTLGHEPYGTVVGCRTGSGARRRPIGPRTDGVSWIRVRPPAQLAAKGRTTTAWPALAASQAQRGYTITC